MINKVTLLGEFLITNAACIFFLPAVTCLVEFKITDLGEFLTTDVAFIFFLVSMNRLVDF